MHIPKTGGTTLRLLLELQLSHHEIYPFRNYMQAKGPIKQELVSGHFPYWFCKNLDPQFASSFKITILRDPIERYLSFLRAKKKADIELHDLESVLQLRNAPSRKYHYGLMDNALCRHLALEPNLEGVKLLESAKMALHQFDCVLFFENYVQEVIDLFTRLGIELSENEIPQFNITQKEPVSPALLKEVIKLNELDIQLYQYAKTHLFKKKTIYSIRTSSYSDLLKQVNEVDYTFDLPLNGTGWSFRDSVIANSPIYRWVMDKPAKINFHLEAEGDYELFFDAHLLTEEVTPQVVVNGMPMQLVRLDHQLFSRYYGIIPKQWVTQFPTELSFSSPKAFHYRDFYPAYHNRNYPPLSFAVNRIQIIKRGP